MCGISIILRLTNNSSVNLELIDKMSNSIKHRGPDNKSKYIDDRIALGHQRLKIIDLSKLSNQPLLIKNHSLIFNGEIYNYIEIRDELIKNHNINFFSSGDAEVLLQSYLIWGEKCLEKFNGIYSFAIWNSKEKKLFCARDRFGVKPFYYY